MNEPQDARTLVEIKMTVGDRHFDAENYEAALKSYSEAIDLCPGSAICYNSRAECYLKLLNYSSALADARQATRLDPGFDEAHVRVAKCCRMLGDVFGMELALKKVLKADPKSTEVDEEQMALRELRRLQPFIKGSYDAKIFGATRVYLDYVLMMAPASVEYRNLKAECLVYLNRCPAALEIAEDVIKQDPTSADAVFVRGLCLYYTDDVEKCILLFENALSLDPDHEKSKKMRIKAKEVKALREEGIMMFKKCRYRGARLAYTEALEIDATNKEINSKLLYNRALVNTRLGDHVHAIEDCTDGLLLNGQCPKALVLRGQCLSKLGAFEEAVADFEKALELESTSEIQKLLRDAKKSVQRLGCYKILGVERSASKDAIKRAFHKKARLHHPDRHATDSPEKKSEEETKFLEVVEAYQMLSNESHCPRDENGQKMETQPDLEEMFRSFFWNENIPLYYER